MKAARRKLEDPMPAAMPCKIPIKSSGDTHRNIGKRRTRFACNLLVLLMPTSSQDQGFKELYTSLIKIASTKWMNIMTHYSLVRKFIPMPQAIKVSDAKAAVEK